MGWFKQEGIDVELVPLPGSTDCVKTSPPRKSWSRCRAWSRWPSCRPQGIKAKFFYTAYQSNIYGIAVPADSPIQKHHATSRARRIGVTTWPRPA